MFTKETICPHVILVMNIQANNLSTFKFFLSFPFTISGNIFFHKHLFLERSSKVLQ